MAGLFEKLMGKIKAAPVDRQSYGTTAAPMALPMNINSIFDLLRIPQQAQFDVRAAQGTKPKNYVPAAISMRGVPVASVFGLPGASAMPENIFTVTPASGTKPKNYKAAQIAMNAPQIAGPAAMQQMLALMGNTGAATPFAPFGQG